MFGIWIAWWPGYAAPLFVAATRGTGAPRCLHQWRLCNEATPLCRPVATGCSHLSSAWRAGLLQGTPASQGISVRVPEPSAKRKQDNGALARERNAAYATDQSAEGNLASHDNSCRYLENVGASCSCRVRRNSQSLDRNWYERTHAVHSWPKLVGIIRFRLLWCCETIVSRITYLSALP